MSGLSVYPDAIDGYAQLPLVVDDVTRVDAVTLNRLREAILNIEIELGIVPSGDADTVSERLTIMQSILETGIPPDVEARMEDIEDSVLALEAVVDAMVDNLHSYTNDAGIVAIGDAVYQDSTVDDKVFLANATNGATNIIVGVVAGLMDDTNCVVCSTGGIVTGLVGLTRGADYWLSTSGITENTLTTVKPNVNAYYIGTALSATSLLVSISPFETGVGEHLTDLQALSVATIADQIMVSTAAGTWALETGAVARASLGLVIGTDVQPFDTHLEDLAALTPATIADEIMVSTAAGTWALESGDPMRTSLGLAIGSDVQAFDTHLEDLSALTPATAADQIMVSTAAGAWALEAGVTARTSLGLAIGSDIQAFDTHLEDLAALSPATVADEIMVSTAAGTWALESGTTARTSLGLAIGSDVQAFDTHLEDLSALTPATVADQIMVSTAAGTWALETGDPMRTSLGLAIGSDVMAYDATMLVDADIGTTVQAFDTHLEDLAALTVASSADQIMVSTGIGTWALETGATARTSLGLGTGDSPSFSSLTINTGDIQMPTSGNITWAANTEILNISDDLYIKAEDDLVLRPNDDIVFQTGLGTTTIGRFDGGLLALKMDGSVYIGESVAATADLAAYGQWWVKNDAPNLPMFTTDTGVDNQLQYQSAHLDDLQALTTATIADQIMVSTAAGVWALESGTTMRTSLGLGTGDSPSFSSLTINTGDIQMSTNGNINWGTNTEIKESGSDLFIDGADDIFMRPDSNFVVAVGTTTYATFDGPLQSLILNKSMYMVEQASALADTLGSGQWWVKNTGPNVPMFTTDTGIDNQLQYQSAALDDLTNAGTVPGNSYFLVGTGAGTLGWETTSTARTSIGLGNGDSPQFTSLTLTTALNMGSGDNINLGGTSSYIEGNNSNLTYVAGTSDDHIFREGSTTFVTFDGGLESVKITKSLYMTEQASALADTTAQGQWWVKTASPNVPMFTTDTGIDNQLQYQSAALDDLTNAGTVPGNSYFLVGTGAGTLGWETTTTARTSIGLGTTDSPSFNELTLTGDNLYLAASSQIRWVDSDTQILENTSHNMFIDSNNDLYLRPDGNIVIAEGTTTWASFNANGTITPCLTIGNGTTASPNTSDMIYIKGDSGGQLMTIENLDSGSPDGLWIDFSGIPNGAADGGDNYLVCLDAGGSTGQIEGDAIGGVNYTKTSDRRLKKNIRDAPSQMSNVRKIQIREYERKRSGKTQMGVVTQELELIFPQLVMKHEKNNSKIKITHELRGIVEDAVNTGHSTEWTTQVARLPESRVADYIAKLEAIPGVRKIVAAPIQESDREYMYDTMEYGMMVVPLIKAFQELADTVDSLKAKINEMENA